MRCVSDFFLYLTPHWDIIYRQFYTCTARPDPNIKIQIQRLNVCLPALTLPSFPYPDKDPQAHAAIHKTLYTLLWHGTPIGYMLPATVSALEQVPPSIRGALTVDHTSRTLSAFHDPPTEAERSRVVAATTAHWRAHHTFAILSGWRNELYPAYGPRNELLFSIERTASTLFGVVTYGVHMTAYVRDAAASHGLRVWVPRRARGKQTYPGMLDNTVAGGMATGEDPFECLVREADEEASLPEALVRAAAVPQGTITYTYIRERRAGGEAGMIQPECQYVYDLELPAEVVPRPNDNEVEAFYLWSVEEVREAMGRGEFKPNCALLMVDFFIRWGIVTAENEVDFEEIKRRLHRKLEFPGPHRA